MSKIEKRGRPQKTTNADINIKDLQVEYLSTKPDDYNNSINYFKIVDSELKSKLKSLLAFSPDLKIPLWKTEDKGEYILKIKGKFIKFDDPTFLFKSKEKYLINVDFVYYDMVAQNIKGYYGMITVLQPKIL